MSSNGCSCGQSVKLCHTRKLEPLTVHGSSLAALRRLADEDVLFPDSSLLAAATPKLRPPREISRALLSACSTKTEHLRET